jgi:hypothetical protein
MSVASFRQGNPNLVGADSLIESKMAALRNRLGNYPHHIAKSMRERIAIAEAVADGDLAKANRILIGHIARKEGARMGTPGPRADRFCSDRQAVNADAARQAC